MKDSPLVSVIIPCYNVADYVEKAIQSILVQTHTNLEILIINDGSQDNTLSTIKKFIDPRIRIINFEKNLKKVGSVNIVLQQVKGDYITFQDADDWSEPKRIEEQIAAFNNSSIGICFTHYRFVGQTNFVPSKIALNDLELKDEFLEFGHKKNTSFHATNCPSMMITAEVLKKTGGYHPYFAGRVAEDIQWIYRILKDFEGVTVNKVLYNYSVREGSFTQLQLSGKNAKYAYSWQLLSKIIYKDVHEKVDLLTKENEPELKKLELEACEEALLAQIKITNDIRQIYQNSASFKIGNLILKPVRMITGLRKALNK